MIQNQNLTVAVDNRGVKFPNRGAKIIMCTPEVSRPAFQRCCQFDCEFYIVVLYNGGLNIGYVASFATCYMKWFTYGNLPAAQVI